MSTILPFPFLSSPSPTSTHSLFPPLCRGIIAIHGSYSATDFMLLLLLSYTSLLFALPSFSPSSSSIVFHATHALAWCLFHSFGLGTVLRAQSESKFLVRHFLKHYHYPTSTGVGRRSHHGREGSYGREGSFGDTISLAGHGHGHGEGRHGRDDGAGEGAVREAFMNWKVVYNLSMCMTYGVLSSLSSFALFSSLPHSFPHPSLCFSLFVWMP